MEKDFHHIIRRCQTLNAMNKRLAKLQDNMSTLSPDLRRRRYISIQVAQEKLALQEHELHCEMVALGIADANEDRYGNITLTFQFGPTVLYFHRPGEAPAVQDGDQGELSPLEMAIEEQKQPEPQLKMFDATTEQVIDPVEALKTFPKVEGKQFFEDVPKAGVLELQDEEEVNQKVVQPSLESWEKKMEAEQKAAVQELTKPQQLKAAQKHFDATGEVTEGFTLISGKIYRKVEKDDPDRHMKAAEDQADEPPATPAEKPAKPKKEAAPKKEPAKKPEPEALVKDDAGGPWSGDRKVSDELLWD